MSRQCTGNLFTSYLLTYHLPRPRLCTCLASPQLARLAVRGGRERSLGVRGGRERSLASDLEPGAGLHACVHGAPATEPTPTEPTERTSEPPSSRDDAEALREDSVSQSKGEL